jgi:hypothetical protein
MGDCSPVISAAIFRASNVIVPNNAGRGEPDFGALPRAERTEGRHGFALFDPGLILESVTSPGTVKVNFANYQWIGALLRDARVCYGSVASGVRTWNDTMKRKEVLIGKNAKGSNAYVMVSLRL